MQTRALLIKQVFVDVVSQIKHKKVNESLQHESWVDDIKEELEQSKKIMYGVSFKDPRTIQFLEPNGSEGITNQVRQGYPK